MQHEKILQELNDPLAQKLINSAIPARLAYNGLDGLPRVIPIGFYWNGAQFIMATATNAPKVRALKANPKVALTIDTESFPPNVLLVRGSATIDIVDGIPPEYLEASRRYVSEEQWPEFEKGVRATYKQMARIAIEPEWVKIMDFVTRVPSIFEQRDAS